MDDLSEGRSFYGSFKAGVNKLGANPSPLAEQAEIAARLRSGSLLVCDDCGGQGFTDGGHSACAACGGIGVWLPGRTEGGA